MPNPKEEVKPESEIPKAPSPNEVPVHPLDAIFKAEEAEITKLLEHPTVDTSTTVPAETPPPEPKKEEAPSAETSPAETPPSPEPPKEPPVETKPAEGIKEPEKPEKREKPKYWKELRETQRLLKEEKKKREDLEHELQAQRAQQPPDRSSEVEPEIDDPLTQVSKEVKEAKEGLKQTQEKLDQLHAAEQQRAVNDAIVRQEADFSKDHPDYHEARLHVLKTEHDEYERIGALDTTADHLMTNNPELVEKHLESEQIDVFGNPIQDEADAARDLAFRILAENKRQALIAVAQRAGRNIAQTVYELAKIRGYQPKTQTQKEPPPQPKPTGQERIQRAKEQESAAQSLSAMQSTSAPLNRQVSSRQQILDMDSDERDRYIVEMDQKDPDWFKNLG